jgi:uncharacterized protein (TIGR02246 family)
MAAIREAIRQAYRGLEEAFFRGDAEAMSMVYAEDAEWLVPEAPPIKGRQAIAQTWKHIVGNGGNTLRVEVREVQEAGEWAYEIGAFTATAADGSVLNSGKYIVIWRIQPDGSWKTHRDIFNWDIPPRPA